MRFKNRYYLVEIRWESVAGGGNVAAANAASATAAAASSSSGSSAASAPSLRHVDVSLQSYQLLVSLREAVLLHFGDLVVGRLNQSLGVRYLNTLTNIAIIRCARADHRAVGATLSFLSQLRNRGVIIKTIHLAGTIRSCQKAAVALQRRRMGELREQMTRAEEELAAAASGAAGPAAAATTGALTASEHAGLSAAIVGTTARTNQSAAKNAQQVFRQLSLLLSQYNAARAAAAASSSSSSMAAVSSSASASVAPVSATPASISAALDQVLAQSEEEILAMET